MIMIHSFQRFMNYIINTKIGTLQIKNILAGTLADTQFQNILKPRGGMILLIKIIFDIPAEQLVQEGFTVLPYINADPVIAKRLQEVGCATVMPLGAPIGSNGGLQTRDQIRIILDQATVPVVVDAGIGAPSHAAEAMELGADAVLVNTAIAVNDDPCRMARAFAQAAEAGRMAYEIGLGATHATAQATSPLTAFLDE